MGVGSKRFVQTFIHQSLSPLNLGTFKTWKRRNIIIVYIHNMGKGDELFMVNKKTEPKSHVIGYVTKKTQNNTFWNLYF